MAGIFDTGISEGRAIQQSIGEPSISPQSKGISFNIDPKDSYELAGQQRMQQLASIDESRRLQRERERAAEQSNKNLEGLTRGLMSRYSDIDTKINNPIERARLKREANLTALAAAGKDNAGYINGIVDQLSTKREARGDGMINILDSRGNVIGVEAGARDDVLQGRINRHEEKIDSVFPNTLDAFGGLVDRDIASGNHLTEGTISELVSRLKNEAENMKATADDYHVLSNQLPSTELPKLTTQATARYLQSVGGVFSTFTSPDILKAMRAGNGIDRNDMEVAIQQVRRDVIDEIIQNKVPVPVQDIEAYIQKNIDSINKTYDNMQKNSLISVETAAKQLEAEDRIHRSLLGKQYNTAEMDVMSKVSGFMSKTVGATVTSTQAAEQAKLSGNTGQAKLFTKLAEGSATLAEGVEPVLANMGQLMYQSTFDFQRYTKDVKTAKTRDDYIDAARSLSKITNHTSGWTLAPQVAKVVEETMPMLIEATQNGVLSEDDLNNITDQLGQYGQYSKDMLRNAGYTEDEFIAQNQESTSLLSTLWENKLPIALGLGALFFTKGKLLKKAAPKK